MKIIDNFQDFPEDCFRNKIGQIEDSGETSQPIDFEWDLSTYYEQINVKSYFKYGGLGAFSKFVEHFSGESFLTELFLLKEDVELIVHFAQSELLMEKACVLEQLIL